MTHATPIAIAVTFALATAALATEGDPHVARVCAVAPDVLAVTVDAGKAVIPGQEPYVEQPGDRIKVYGKPPKTERTLIRDGKEVGCLAGPDGNVLWRAERMVGSRLDTVRADKPEAYAVASQDHEAYGAPRRPEAVHRKSKPRNMLRIGHWKWAFPMRHVLYLRLPAAMKPGATYTVRFAGLPLEPATYRHDPAGVRSEAVHVNQVGFRPDDPVKLAFLSCWLGTGGGLEYPEGITFRVLRAGDGKAVLTGKTALRFGAGRHVDPYKRDYNGTDVHEMDFSSLTEPGEYRVCVEGVGCGYPFRIAADAYREAFVVSARGFYHQRSGIALGPPHTDYERPRSFHPADGVKVHHSDCMLMESGNGLNCFGTDKSNFQNLVDQGTDRLVENAWGGYMDAGDWDRRIQHLVATRMLLDLYEMFPATFGELSLNIPESGNDLPDVIDEGLFNLDVYRRMQTPEGGIRGGIESAEHPRAGECSWQESLKIFAYAPGPWSSHLYAATAARAARLLGKLDADRAAVYADSARRAWAFAERELPKLAGRLKPKCHQPADARNLAAVELFRLTGEKAFHDVFLATTAFTRPDVDVALWQSHDQREAAWSYVCAARDGVREAIQANARKAILREADVAAGFARKTGFAWVKSNPWRPISYGTLTGPDAVTVLWAHRLTGDRKHLATAVLACQYAFGANPDNLCYTTGLGDAWPANPLVEDSRRRGVEDPPGLTLFGPMDPSRKKDYWVFKLMGDRTVPRPWTWPTAEAFWDVWLFPPVTEYTPQKPMTQAAWFRGYLMGRE